MNGGEGCEGDDGGEGGDKGDGIEIGLEAGQECLFSCDGDMDGAGGGVGDLPDVPVDAVIVTDAALRQAARLVFGGAFATRFLCVSFDLRIAACL